MTYRDFFERFEAAIIYGGGRRDGRQYKAWTSALSGITGEKVDEATLFWLKQHWDGLTPEQHDRIFATAALLFGNLNAT